VPRAYFYVFPQADVYQDDVVLFAEGLRDHGWQLSANLAYWRSAPGAVPLLADVHPSPPPDTALVVVSSGWTRSVLPDGRGGFREERRPPPPGLFAPGRRYRTVCLDADDAYGGATWSAEYAAFDLILRAHFNRRCHHPANHHPWVLGFNDRIIAHTAAARPWRERRAEILVNFGASHPFQHSARRRGIAALAAAAPRFAADTTRDDLTVPPESAVDRLMWEQTQHRHTPAYFARLGHAQAVAAFCGDLVPATPRFPRYLVGGGRRARLARIAHEWLGRLHRAPERLMQWDSWRFWEALAAGCLVYHLDLDYYGVALPVRPEPFVHYVPIRLDCPTAAAEPFERDPGLAERIARQGRDWALQFCTPRALVGQLLSTHPALRTLA